MFRLIFSFVDDTISEKQSVFEKMLHIAHQ